MLLQGTIIAALLLGLFMAWVAGCIVCFGVLTAWRPFHGWMKRVLLSGLVSAVLLGLVFSVDAWTGIDDLSLFVNYLIGSLSAAVLAMVYLAIRMVQRRS